MHHLDCRCLLILLLACCAGCLSQSSGSDPELVWGRRGISEGRFQKPRAIAIDDQDRLYVVDMTARIQVFDRDGKYLRSWHTPESVNGRPTGLSISREGLLMVADTHYFRVLFYTPEGELLPKKTIGGVCGTAPGEFHFVTDAVQDSEGNYYVAEYGEYDRIQKFSPDGKFLLQWGKHGSEPGQFMRPQSLAADRSDRIWVADACNHRIQVFDATGQEAKLVKMWGSEGNEPGQLRYPYGILLDDAGDVYVCEFGNHRVQKFTPDGELLKSWGSNGRRHGQLAQPWSFVLDSDDHLHILDTYNHRVQRFEL